ncbi:MAG: DsbA family protein [Sediminibacterium sp.]|nr:DsbA family protein [Sediminibacterium sp.]
MQQQANPLLCNTETGICEIPATPAETASNSSPFQGPKPVQIIYYTDPICSSCWGIEPQLRKLKLEYGHYLTISYKMGGLLPNWSYNSGGISQPADVAKHWDEAGLHYEMPINGDVWLEDPLDSSYPPSLAFKAAQMQDEDKAVAFLRNIREMLFLHKKNITRWEFLESAASASGLDVAQFKKDYEGPAATLFNEDLRLGKSLGVRGFPTLFFSDRAGRTEMVYGSKPYAAYENAILQLHPSAVKNQYSRAEAPLFAVYPTLTVKEFAVLTDRSVDESQNILDAMTQENKLVITTTSRGAIWKWKQ